MLTHQELLRTYEARLSAYIRERLDQEGEDVPVEDVLRFSAVLEAATPGLTEALRWQTRRRLVLQLLNQDRGDGLPVMGPVDAFTDGDRVWKLPEQWTPEDFRMTLAWWQSYPGPDRARRLAALIAYGEARWPTMALTRQSPPDFSDLPPWASLLDDDEP